MTLSIDPNSSNFYYIPSSTNSISESFKWYSKEYTAHDVSRDKIRLKIVSAKKDAISLNNRKYVEEALIKSCNSWINRPVCVNHDRRQVIGNIELTDYEDGQLEHVAIINKQPYVDLFRQHSAEIKGFSLGAIYVFNKCAMAGCGKKFMSEEEWRGHMAKDHFVKDLPKEPHGIIGEELSVVFGNETAGLETSWQIAETENKGFTALCNTLIQEKHSLILKPTEAENTGKTPLNIAQSILKTDNFSDVNTEDINELYNFLTSENSMLAEPYLSGLKAIVKVGDYTLSQSGIKETKNKLSETVKERDNLTETVSTQQKQLNSLQEQLTHAKEEITRRDGLVEANRKLKIDNDNLRDQLKPVFKAHSTPLQATEKKETVDKPYIITPDTGTS